MKSHGIGHRLYYLPLLLFVVMGLVLPGSCLERERVDVSELQAFEAFFDADAVFVALGACFGLMVVALRASLSM